MSNIHEEFSKRGARLVRRLTNMDVLACRAKYLDSQSMPININSFDTKGIIMIKRGWEEKRRLELNKKFSKPYWELMKKRKQRDLD